MLYFIRVASWNVLNAIATLRAVAYVAAGCRISSLNIRDVIFVFPILIPPHVSIIFAHINAANTNRALSGADPGFEKGGFNVVPKSDTGGATHNYL